MTRTAPRSPSGLLLGALGLAAIGVLVGIALWLVPGNAPGASPAAGPLAPSPPPSAVSEAPPLEPTGPLPSLPLTAGRGDAPADDAATAAAHQGLVEARVVGRLVDRRGLPIPGASVVVVPGPEGRRALGLPPTFLGGEPDWPRMGPARSDDQGRFEVRLGDVPTPAGTTDGARPTLIASHPDRRLAVVACPPWRGVDVDLGDVVMEPHVPITGRVIDPGGRPLAGARLVAAAGQSGAMPMSSTDWRLVRWRLRAETGADGRFSLAGWGTQRLDLDVSCDGHIRRIVSVPVGAARHALGDVVLEPGGRLTGRVVDGTGTPLPGVELVARPASVSRIWGGTDTALRDIRLYSTYNGMGDARTLSGPDGSFEFPSLSEGLFDVLAADDLREPAAVRGVVVGGPSLEIVLGEAAALVVRVVSDRDGRPVTGAGASARRIADDSAAGHTDGSLDPQLPVLTGAEAAGAAGLPPQTPGLVFVRQAGPLGTRLLVEGPGHGALQVRLPGVAPASRQEHVVRLPREARLVGRVVDGQGRPLAGATVSATPADGNDGTPRRVEVLSGDDGRFALGGLEAGSWAWSHELAGRSAGPGGEVSLTPGETRDLGDLPLYPASSLEGVVLAPEGTPAVGVDVSVLPVRPPFREVARTVSDGAGRFSFLGIAPGRWFVQALPGGLAQASVPAGRRVDVTLQLRHPGLIAGRVYGDTGPVARALVQAVRRGDGGPAPRPADRVERTHADGQGRFELELPAGSYSLVARAQGRVSGPVDVSLGWGERRESDITFHAGRLEGRVTAAADGAPLEGLVVRPRLLREDGEGTYDGLLSPGTTRTDPQGRFEVGGLPAGRWRIEVLPRPGSPPVGTAEVTVGERSTTRVEVTVPSG